ncbi:hypothetical protein ACNKHT_16245 [Shigella flexneri]
MGCLGAMSKGSSDRYFQSDNCCRQTGQEGLEESRQLIKVT